MNRVPPPESSSLPPGSLSPGSGSSSPPQKKVKIDEEDSDSVSSSEPGYSDELNDTSSPIRPTTYSQYDSDEDYCTYENQKIDKALWEKYYQQVYESEGFDITDFPGHCPMTTVFPMTNYLNDPKDADTMKDYAGQALKLYNDERGTNCEVNNVLKVNGGGCRYFIFYITFSVKTHDREDDIFQAKVVRDLDCSLEFPVVRPKDPNCCFESGNGHAIEDPRGFVLPLGSLGRDPGERRNIGIQAWKQELTVKVLELVTQKIGWTVLFSILTIVKHYPKSHLTYILYIQLAKISFSERTEFNHKL